MNDTGEKIKQINASDAQAESSTNEGSAILDEINKTNSSDAGALLRDFLKKSWRMILIVVGIMTLIPIIVCWIAPHCRSEITSDGILEYIVGAGTFVSTIFLSVLALYQTHRIQMNADAAQTRMEKMAHDANEISKKLLNLEKNNYILNIRPFINVGSYSIDSFKMSDIKQDQDSFWIDINGKNVSDAGAYIGIVLLLVNSTDYPLTIEYKGAKAEKVKWTNISIKPRSQKHYIKQGESIKIVFFANSIFMQKLNDTTATISFILENRFAQRYKESFELAFYRIEQVNNEWHYLFYTQNFKISKLSRDENGNEIEIPEEL